VTETLLDLEKLAAAPRVREPFAWVVVPGFVRAAHLEAVLAAFPPIRGPGSFPAEKAGGPAFRALVAAMTAPATAAALGAALGIDLARAPTLVTVRGRCRAEDGRIHTDSGAKLVSALLYLNPGWRAAGGRLRLLRGAHDLEDMLVEVPPEAGTLVAFRRSAVSFHGHHPFVGERRSLQVNWMGSGLAASRERLRHRLSARVKRLAGAA